MGALAMFRKKNPDANAHGAEGVTSNVINNRFIGLAQA
jgi:hypothetical protein